MGPDLGPTIPAQHYTRIRLEAFVFPNVPPVDREFDQMLHKVVDEVVLRVGEQIDKAYRTYGMPPDGYEYEPEFRDAVGGGLVIRVLLRPKRGTALRPYAPGG